MDRDITINPQTFYVLKYLKGLLALTIDVPIRLYLPGELNYIIRHARWEYENPNIELIRNEFRVLNSIFEKADVPLETKPLFVGEDISDWYWLTYDNNIEVIPIYDDGVALVKKELILPTSEISFLLKYVVVPGTKNGLDIDNHGFGYHFHYGKVRGHRLIRYDLMLTFYPTDTYPPLSQNITPLYAEKHGGYKSIDISTIGNNKRRPIYNVCESEMTKKQIVNFKPPGRGAMVFYP
jgi:hypothetical protein